VNRSSTRSASLPISADRLMTGNHRARATPMSAFAARSAASAARMSGRRSSSSLGSTRGSALGRVLAGGEPASGAMSISAFGVAPVSTASAVWLRPSVSRKPAASARVLASSACACRSVSSVSAPRRRRASCTRSASCRAITVSSVMASWRCALRMSRYALTTSVITVRRSASAV
jgi:hypothetical protein